MRAQRPGPDSVLLAAGVTSGLQPGLLREWALARPGPGKTRSPAMTTVTHTVLRRALSPRAAPHSAGLVSCYLHVCFSSASARPRSPLPPAGAGPPSEVRAHGWTPLGCSLGVLACPGVRAGQVAFAEAPDVSARGLLPAHPIPGPRGLCGALLRVCTGHQRGRPGALRLRSDRTVFAIIDREGVAPAPWEWPSVILEDARR